MLQRTNAPEPGYEIILSQSELPASTAATWHVHPAVGIGVLLGSGKQLSRGQPTRRIIPSDRFQIGVNLPYSLQNGDAPLRVAFTYVKEKSESLTSPAPP